MRERAQLFETAIGGTLHEALDDIGTQPETADIAADDERPNFADSAAERCELATADQPAVLCRHEEAVDMRPDVIETARQQVSFREILHNQRMNRRGIGIPRGANGCFRLERGRSERVWSNDRQR